MRELKVSAPGRFWYHLPSIISGCDPGPVVPSISEYAPFIARKSFKALTFSLLLLLAPGSWGQATSAAPNDVQTKEVDQLLHLLTDYYDDLSESLKTRPTEEELARREADQEDAASLAKIPFSAEKVRLNGAEGIASLARISERLGDDSIPESRRDIAAICGIKTRRSGALIASENRSLKPVGKNQYIARIRLQSGDTTLRINAHQWELKLPQNISASDYLITLLLPSSGTPELHVFAVDDLLAEDPRYIPGWLPDELNLKPTET